MTMTLKLAPDEIAQAIKEYLRGKGYEIKGPVSFEVSAGFPGSNDPREQSGPQLDAAVIKVTQ